MCSELLMPYFKMNCHGPSTEEEEAQCGFTVRTAVEGGCSLSGWQQYILLKGEVYLKMKRVTFGSGYPRLLKFTNIHGKIIKHIL